jgi:hypothetical protein
MNLKHHRFDISWHDEGRDFCFDGISINCDEVLDFISQQELLKKTPEEIIQMLKEGLK